MESESVTVPEIILPLPDGTMQQVFQQLQALDPLHPTSNFGIDLYKQAVEIVCTFNTNN